MKVKLIGQVKSEAVKKNELIKVIDWYHPLGVLSKVDITVSINGVIFKGLLKNE